MAKGIWLYVQIVATIVTILLALLFFQYTLNLHSTAMLVVGALTLLGMPPFVATVVQHISKQLK
jgi:ATP/ADP translocase